MGDGGLLVTNDDAVAARCRQIATTAGSSRTCTRRVGFNLRFNDIRPRCGRVLLRRLDAMNEHRRRIATRYAAGSRTCPCACPPSAREPATCITST